MFKSCITIHNIIQYCMVSSQESSQFESKLRTLSGVSMLSSCPFRFFPSSFLHTKLFRPVRISKIIPIPFLHHKSSTGSRSGLCEDQNIDFVVLIVLQAQCK